MTTRTTTTRTTTTRSGHPAPVRLPGQAAAHEGPVDMTVMYVVHHAFRRDLSAFAAAVPATPVEATATWRALHERWTRFATLLHSHHSGEDTGLWPALLERVDDAGDSAGRAVLEAMEAEHAEIDPLLEACAQGLARMAAGGTADERAALAVRTAALRDGLGRHLAHEEQDALALLQRHLTQEQWRRIERASFSAPVRPGDVAFVVPWACAGLPADVRRRAFADGGRRFALAHALTRRRFERRERVAFAYR